MLTKHAGKSPVDLQLLGARTESEANAPEDGRILSRVYENKYFGFSIRLPAGWCITDRGSFVALQLRKDSIQAVIKKADKDRN